jgi:hypothetical protein
VVLDHPAALGATDDVFNANPPAGVSLISRLLLLSQLATARLLERLEHLNPIEREGEKAQILEQLTAFGNW